MKPLHTWNVSIEDAIRIQEELRNQIVLQKTFAEVKTIGGGDVAYSKSKDLLFGSIVVFSFPEMKMVDRATANGKIPFPYISSLLVDALTDFFRFL